MPSRIFKWAVLLCKFDGEPKPPLFFREFVSGTALGSLNDYWRTMSYGKLDMSSCDIYGWFQMPFALDDPFFDPHKARAEKVKLCKSLFANSLTVDERAAFEAHDGFLVVLGADKGGSGQTGPLGNPDVLLDMNAFRSVYVAHETGHALGFDHSFDTNPDPWDKANDSRPGAYGDSHDIMSAEGFASLPATFDSPFGTAGPSLNALNRETMWWLPPERITTFTHSPGEPWWSQIYIAALNSPEALGALMVRIKAIGFGPLSDVEYCLEYRPRNGWDAGAANDAVVIHMCLPNDKPRVMWSPNDQDWQAGNVFVDVARKLSISMLRFTPTYAIVNILTGEVSINTMSVRRSLAHKVRLKDGLRSVGSAPFASDKLRARLLTHPPQFS